jgi:hypothetical protein
MILNSEVALRVLRLWDNSLGDKTSFVVTFKNGYSLSVIRDSNSMGGAEGFFEIAPIDRNGNITGALLKEEKHHAKVLGWCDSDKVSLYLEKLSLLPEVFVCPKK